MWEVDLHQDKRIEEENSHARRQREFQGGRQLNPELTRPEDPAGGQRSREKEPSMGSVRNARP